MRLNDVFFAGHAFCITLLTLMQICNLVVAAIAKLMSGELLSNFVDFIKKKPLLGSGFLSLGFFVIF